MWKYFWHFSNQNRNYKILKIGFFFVIFTHLIFKFYFKGWYIKYNYLLYYSLIIFQRFWKMVLVIIFLLHVEISAYEIAVFKLYSNDKEKKMIIQTSLYQIFQNNFEINQLENKLSIYFIIIVFKPKALSSPSQLKRLVGTVKYQVTESKQKIKYDKHIRQRRSQNDYIRLSENRYVYRFFFLFLTSVHVRLPIALSRLH